MLVKKKIKDNIYGEFYKSDAKNKKYKVILKKDNEKIKTINFGDKRYE